MHDKSFTFELFALRFQFRALEHLHFPPGNAGNVIRGTLGRIFRKFACAPGCLDARQCAQRAVCAYARLFEPTSISGGPSGLADWPRPFVIRAAHLDGRRFAAQAGFHFDLHVFAMDNPALAYFAFSLSQLMREGLGPGRAGAELTAIDQLDDSGQCGTRIFDGNMLTDAKPLILSLLPEGAVTRRIRVRFLTPTELKSAGQVIREPYFGSLFTRVRDRLHTLRQLYGDGPLPLEFRAVGERASAIKMVSSDLRWEKSERRSGRTGQTHSLGGLVGWADYEGDLTEFIPYLKAAYWTGVGRQTTWGKGHIEVISGEEIVG